MLWWGEKSQEEDCCLSSLSGWNFSSVISGGTSKSEMPKARKGGTGTAKRGRKPRAYGTKSSRQTNKDGNEDEDDEAPGMGSAKGRQQNKREQMYKTLRDRIEDMLLHYQRMYDSLPQLRAKLEQLKLTLKGYRTCEDIRLYRVRKREIQGLKKLIREIESRQKQKQFEAQVRPLIERDNALVASTAGISSALLLQTGGVDSTATAVVDEADLACSVEALPPETCIGDSVETKHLAEEVTQKWQDILNAPLPPVPAAVAAAAPVVSSVSNRITWAPMAPLAFTAPYLMEFMPEPPAYINIERVMADVIDIGADASSVIAYGSTIAMDDDLEEEEAKPKSGAATGAGAGGSAATKRANKKGQTSAQAAQSSSALVSAASSSSSVLRERQQISEQLLSTWAPQLLPTKYVNAHFCSRCHRDMMLLPFEGRSVCLRCRTWVEKFDSALNLGFGEDTQTTTTHEYDQSKHLFKFLQQWHKNNPGPPDQVYIDVIRHYNNGRDGCVHDVKPTPIKDVLNQLGYKEWRNYAERISNRLQNIPVAQLSDSTIKLFTRLFDMIQPVFPLVKDRRHNMLTLYYLLNKFCGIAGLDHLAPCFPLLKTESVVQDQDVVWFRICDVMRAAGFLIFIPRKSW